MIRGILLALLFGPALALAQAPDFVEFESGQVRPLAMSADGSRLFAVNTKRTRQPANRRRTETACVAP